ncbi:MAG: LPS export ABC transporter periplasmic protein LptC [Bacteroidia bacterium]|nr:LPS export ABC transporter periplasmic protein LptC [Bacteroidia bacterium]MBT8267653.1 LPS export ABC transporter periplasmic protein LptC [Bacteroidia bacterium]NNF83052.1 LPS export ABC transporter periplasmic protein LptC [Flavobacteriaceae bacterium]NNK69658.1 LPS export ABC transporter periplasmic protein LptC [Flavobacteriaceae bacterium]
MLGRTYKITLKVTAFVVTLFFSCKNNFKEVQNIGILSSEPLTIAENINTKYTDTSGLKSILKSPKMLNYSNREFAYYEFPDGVDLIIFDDNKNQSHVIADYAIVYDETDLIDLRGNVVLDTHNRDTLFAEQLYYDQERQWLFTNKPVKFRTRDQLIDGHGFDSDRNFNKARVLEVSGVVFLSE